MNLFTITNDLPFQDNVFTTKLQAAAKATEDVAREKQVRSPDYLPTTCPLITDYLPTTSRLLPYYFPTTFRGLRRRRVLRLVLLGAPHGVHLKRWIWAPSKWGWKLVRVGLSSTLAKQQPIKRGLVLIDMNTINKVDERLGKKVCDQMSRTLMHSHPVSNNSRSNETWFSLVFFDLVGRGGRYVVRRWSVCGWYVFGMWSVKSDVWSVNQINLFAITVCGQMSRTLMYSSSDRVLREQWEKWTLHGACRQ